MLQNTKNISADVRGRDVLLVDDILDTGLTLSWLTSRMMSGGAATVGSCVLLRKPANTVRQIEAEFVGFDIPKFLRLASASTMRASTATSGVWP